MHRWKEKKMENTKYDVVALGELLVDFTENGTSNQEIRSMRQIREERPAMYFPC